MRGCSNIKGKPRVLKEFSGSPTITRPHQRETGTIWVLTHLSLSGLLLSLNHGGKNQTFLNGKKQLI
ncbi:hypothetical protein D3C80_98560 [compost metagenome]